MSKYLLTAGLLAAAVTAQTSEEYVDENTGITFQQHVHAATEVSLGIALPSEPTTDFIAQLTAPISSGWAGVTFGGTMTNSILVVAWPNDDEIVSSFRQATGYDEPEILEDSSLSLSTIPDGTFVDGDSFTYTFLCSGCITGDLDSFSPDDETATLGIALSSTEIADPSDPESAINMHEDGFGLFGVDLAAAQSADFESWLELVETS